MGKLPLCCFFRKLMLLHINKSSLKTVSRKDFLQASGSPVRKRSAYKIKVVILKLAIEGSHEFHVR